MHPTMKLVAVCCTWLVGSGLFGQGARAQAVTFGMEDAVVWAQEQVVEGRVDGVSATAGTLVAGADTVAFTVADGAFRVPVRLGAGVTPVVACLDDGAVCADTLRLTLGFTPRPEAELVATVSGREVALHGRVVDAPDGGPLAYAWAPDPGNPAAVALDVRSDSLAVFTLPAGAPAGEYYVDWTVTDTDGDAFRARTFVTATDSGVVPFDLRTDHAAWIDDAILYEISPRFLANGHGGRFEHITARIPELVDLGINTIWLQPIFPTANGGQAYDVTDYFGIWDVLGTADDLRALIETAHASGLRVLFDFVANHSSISHPYAQDAIAHGPRSHYYDFYMRTGDGAPYGFYYNTMTRGAMQFVSYFWDDLVTWDYANPEVERFIIEASRYWIEAFDIDGYRLDAVWGPHARDPDFTRRWRRAMKRVKPEVLLLAEAKAPYSEAYADTGHPSTFESFDVAYDWTDEAGCISQWVWARDCNYSAYTDGAKITLFNYGVERMRARSLRSALTNDGAGFPEDAVILRFLENNDTPRFRAHHTLEQTRMAAALLFALDGIPMLYYGQALGTKIQYPSYAPSVLLTRYDREGMWPYYQHLIRLRKTFPAFTGGGFVEVEVTPSAAAGPVYAFHRPHEGEDVFAAVNMADEAAAVRLALPTASLALDAGTTYYLTDLLSGETRAMGAGELASVEVEMQGYETRLWVLADAPVALPAAAEPPSVPGASLPDAPVLAPSYPNPFRTAATVAFEMPAPGHVRLAVYDLLGREVATLVDGHRTAGRHEARFDGRALPSGVYVYRLEHGEHVQAGTVMLVR